MAYYDFSYRIARIQGRFFRAVERRDAASAVALCARFLWVGWSPIENIRIWREMIVHGFRATYAEGVRGAVDGLADSMNDRGDDREDERARALR